MFSGLRNGESIKIRLVLSIIHTSELAEWIENWCKVKQRIGELYCFFFILHPSCFIFGQCGTPSSIFYVYPCRKNIPE